jgi:hypothetical protein
MEYLLRRDVKDCTNCPIGPGRYCHIVIRPDKCLEEISPSIGLKNLISGMSATIRSGYLSPPSACKDTVARRSGGSRSFAGA